MSAARTYSSEQPTLSNSMQDKTYTKVELNFFQKLDILSA